MVSGEPRRLSCSSSSRRHRTESRDARQSGRHGAAAVRVYRRRRSGVRRVRLLKEQPHAAAEPDPGGVGLRDLDGDAHRAGAGTPASAGRIPSSSRCIRSPWASSSRPCNAAVRRSRIPKPEGRSWTTSRGSRSRSAHASRIATGLATWRSARQEACDHVLYSCPMRILALLMAALSLSAAPAQQVRSEPFVPVGVWYGGGTCARRCCRASPAKEKEAWRRDLTTIKSLGFNSVKNWVDWACAEPERGRYNLRGARPAADPGR